MILPGVLSIWRLNSEMSEKGKTKESYGFPYKEDGASVRENRVQLLILNKILISPWLFYLSSFNIMTTRTYSFKPIKLTIFPPCKRDFQISWIMKLRFNMIFIISLTYTFMQSATSCTVQRVKYNQTLPGNRGFRRDEKH